jgi:hypothetical protein
MDRIKTFAIICYKTYNNLINEVGGFQYEKIFLNHNGKVEGFCIERAEALRIIAKNNMHESIRNDFGAIWEMDGNPFKDIYRNKSIEYFEN